MVQRRAMILLIRVLVVWGSMLLTACDAASLGWQRTRGCYTLAELEQMPEATLLPPQSEIVARSAGDTTDALEDSYHGIIILNIGSRLSREAVLTFYRERLTAWGWRVAATYPREVLWEKADNPLKVELWLLGPDEMAYLGDAAQGLTTDSMFVDKYANMWYNIHGDADEIE